MLTDAEIDKVIGECRTRAYPQDATTPYYERAIARAIIAAYQAKLPAGVEMPEPLLFSHELLNEGRPNGVHLGVNVRGICEQAHTDGETSPDVKEWYTAEQLQQYAAAAAAQAREKALDEAHAKCWELAAKYEKAHHPTCEAVADECAEAIDKLKGGE